MFLSYAAERVLVYIFIVNTLHMHIHDFIAESHSEIAFFLFLFRTDKIILQTT